MLSPLIWIKNVPAKITEYLTRKVSHAIGADRPNRFKTWKLKQSWWLQLLIELPVYVLLIWLFNVVLNSFGYSIGYW